MIHITRILNMHDDFGESTTYYKLNVTHSLNNLKNKSIFQKFIVLFIIALNSF